MGDKTMKLFAMFKKTKESKYGDVDLSMDFKITKKSKEEMFNDARRDALERLVKGCVKEQLFIITYGEEALRQTKQAQNEQSAGQASYDEIKERYPKAETETFFHSGTPYFSTRLSMDVLIDKLTKMAVEAIEDEE